MGFAEPNDKYSLLRKHIWMNPVRLVREVEKGALTAAYNWDGVLRSHSYIADLWYYINQVVTKKSKSIENAIISKKARMGKLSDKLKLAESDINERVNVALTNYAAMNAIAQKNHAKFIMFLQPSAITKIGRNKHETALLHYELLHRSGINPTYKTYEKIFYSRFRRTKKDFPYDDISGIFNNNPKTTYADDVHYTNYGANLIAEAIFQQIRLILSKRDKNRKNKDNNGNQGTEPALARNAHFFEKYLTQTSTNQ